MWSSSSSLPPHFYSLYTAWWKNETARSKKKKTLPVGLLMSQDAYPFILRLGVPLNALCKPSKNNEQDSQSTKTNKNVSTTEIFTGYLYIYTVLLYIYHKYWKIGCFLMSQCSTNSTLEYIFIRGRQWDDRSGDL